MSDFECLFRSAIDYRRAVLDGKTKFVSIHRRGPTTFLQVRVYRFISGVFKPTAEGISLSGAQARTLIDLTKDILKVNRICFRNESLTPVGVHNLSDDAWLTIDKEGKDVLLLRKKGEGVKGITLILAEFLELKTHFEAVSFILFQSPHPENVDLIQPLVYETDFLLNQLKKENCPACSVDYREAHTCAFMELDKCVQLYFEEATKRIQLPRVFTRVNYLHDVLKRANPLPTIEDVREYLKDPAWFLEEVNKGNAYHCLLYSFEEL